MLICTTLTALLLAPPALAETPARDLLIRERHATHVTRARKCLSEIRYSPRAWLVAPWNRVRLAEEARMDHVRAMYRASRCLPTSAAGIIRYVFPDSTEGAAVRVAYCESRLYRYAANPRSSARGIWQLLALHYAGRFDPFDPWASTRYALRLSDGGTDWGPWRASIGCHGQT